MKVTVNYLAVLLTLACLSSCGGGSGSGKSNQGGSAYSYSVPQQLSDGWTVGHLESGGLEPARLVDMMNRIDAEGHDSFLRNILIVRNGELVFEEYFGDGGIDTPSHMQSATKSVVSAIFGIAYYNGYVSSTDDSLFNYFPEYEYLNSPGKEEISLHHVLSMTPGFEWNELTVPTFNNQNDNIAAYLLGNYIRYALQKPLVDTPGQNWTYNSACPMFLAGIVKNQSGVHIDEYAVDFLFGPLGVTGIRWEYQDDGLPLATGGLWLRPRDIAKFGQLYLDDGRWQGQQVIPAEWIRSSLTAHATINSAMDYGYLWWTRVFAGHRLWFASGYGGQLIITVPGQELLIVINAEYTRMAEESARRESEIWGLLNDFILPSN